jgi:hypothetical protein
LFASTSFGLLEATKESIYESKPVGKGGSRVGRTLLENNLLLRGRLLRNVVGLYVLLSRRNIVKFSFAMNLFFGVEAWLAHRSVKLKFNLRETLERQFFFGISRSIPDRFK